MHMVLHIHQLKEQHHDFQMGSGIAQPLHPLCGQQLLFCFMHTPCMDACGTCLDSNYFAFLCIAVTVLFAITIIQVHFIHS